uniref:Putative secreted protein n=1 Tax=Rhipicephalus microplus TaxID=6941 RepID=A0A6M2DAI1_RHIMP
MRCTFFCSFNFFLALSFQPASCSFIVMWWAVGYLGFWRIADDGEWPPLARLVPFCDPYNLKVTLACRVTKLPYSFAVRLFAPFCL